MSLLYNVHGILLLLLLLLLLLYLRILKLFPRKLELLYLFQEIPITDLIISNYVIRQYEYPHSSVMIVPNCTDGVL